ncbi:MAG: hypothetical protein WC872_01015 [Candidatus Absconditabacterales bacterium]
MENLEKNDLQENEINNKEYKNALSELKNNVNFEKEINDELKNKKYLEEKPENGIFLWKNEEGKILKGSFINGIWGLNKPGKNIIIYDLQGKKYFTGAYREQIWKQKEEQEKFAKERKEMYKNAQSSSEIIRTPIKNKKGEIVDWEITTNMQGLESPDIDPIDIGVGLVAGLTMAFAKNSVKWSIRLMKGALNQKKLIAKIGAKAAGKDMLKNVGTTVGINIIGSGIKMINK